MAQRLKVLAVLVEGWNWAYSIHTRQLRVAHNSSSRRSDTFFQPLRVSTSCIYMTHINKINLQKIIQFIISHKANENHHQYMQTKIFGKYVILIHEQQHKRNDEALILEGIWSTPKDTSQFCAPGQNSKTFFLMSTTRQEYVVLKMNVCQWRLKTVQ